MREFEKYSNYVTLFKFCKKKIIKKINLNLPLSFMFGLI